MGGLKSQLMEVHVTSPREGTHWNRGQKDVMSLIMLITCKS